MSNSLERFADLGAESSYSPDRPSIISGYSSRSKKDTYHRLPLEIQTQIEELVLQSTVNWPGYEPSTLVSDIANIDPMDTNDAFFKLWADKTLISSPQEYNVLILNTDQEIALNR